jgi:hypothetical protein
MRTSSCSSYLFDAVLRAKSQFPGQVWLRDDAGALPSLPFFSSGLTVDNRILQAHNLRIRNQEDGMKVSANSTRVPQQVSASLAHKLNLYALAANAAGVGLLALAQPAEAKIVYTRAHQPIDPNTKYQLDLNHDGITDFTIVDFHTSGFGALSIQAPSGNSVVGEKFFNHGASMVGAADLPAGAKVQGNKKFYPGTLLMAASRMSSFGGASSSGLWVHVTNRYLGLRFAVQGKIHYGWARLNINCASFQCTGLLTGYAYESVPNKAIVTGKTKGSDVITVQPATLGHLSQGAAWRVGHTATTAR